MTRTLAAALAAGLLTLPGGATAQPSRVPAGVELRVPPCEGPVSWSELAAALRIELRSMGSDLGADGAEARLVIGGLCGDPGEPLTARLVDLRRDRTVQEVVPPPQRAIDPAREIALALSELVRSRWQTLDEPEADRAPAPRSARAPAEESSEALDARIDARVRELRAPPPSPVPLFLDVTVGALATPAGGAAYGDLTLAASVRLGRLVRLRAVAVGRLGVAPTVAGDLTLGGAAGGLGVMVAPRLGEAVLAVGPRLEGGWHVASAPRCTPSAVCQGADRGLLALVLDAVLRVPLSDGEGPTAWLVVAAEVGAHLVDGLDLRFDPTGDSAFPVVSDRGPRLGLGLGVAVATERRDRASAM
ncbi:MAG: hypothetical protein ACFCGT_22705 [Sandaracinaceae bacterium]